MTVQEAIIILKSLSQDPHVMWQDITCFGTVMYNIAGIKTYNGCTEIILLNDKHKFTENSVSVYELINLLKSQPKDNWLFWSSDYFNKEYYNEDDGCILSVLNFVESDYIEKSNSWWNYIESRWDEPEEINTRSLK